MSLPIPTVIAVIVVAGIVGVIYGFVKTRRDDASKDGFKTLCNTKRGDTTHGKG